MGKYLPKVSESIMAYFECLDKRGECDGKWLVVVQNERKQGGLSLMPYSVKSVKL